jgi:sugar O-acyltransferase (sialic acid O-acetyltransferase NeuD family)
MRNLLIYGSKDFGRIVKQIAIDIGYQFKGFIDDYYTGKDVLGDFKSIRDKFSPDEYEIAIAIGYNNLKARWSVYEKVISSGYKVATLIHPKAYVCSTASVAEGAIIMNNAVIDMRTVLEELVVVWPGAIVNHDSIIGKNTFVSPNATICGFVNVGGHSFIGAGSVIVDHRNVPENSFIKAGEIFK